MFHVLEAMPIYEYVCDACGQITETLQRISDPPMEDCPSGDGGSLTRVLSTHNVGGVAKGWEGADCDRSEAPACGGCDLAGTGCS
jgi:putative FmdB family regulatory protein